MSPTGRNHGILEYADDILLAIIFVMQTAKAFGSTSIRYRPDILHRLNG